MKNIIAENFLRFAPKNLSEVDLQKIQRLSEQEDVNNTETPAASAASAALIFNMCNELPTNFDRTGNPRYIAKTTSDNHTAVLIRKPTGPVTWDARNPFARGASGPDAEHFQMSAASGDGIGMTINAELGNKLLIFTGGGNLYFALGNEVTGDVAAPTKTNNIICCKFSPGQIDNNIAPRDAQLDPNIDYSDNRVAGIYGYTYFTNSFKSAANSIINDLKITASNNFNDVAFNILKTLVTSKLIKWPWGGNEYNANLLTSIQCRNEAELRSDTIGKLMKLI